MKQYPSYDDIVDNIKTIISEKGVKQATVAERAGFTPQEFSNMLNERRKLIRVEFIPRIAKALGVQIEELFSYDKDQKVSGHFTNKSNKQNEFTHCFYCKSLIAKTDKYCMYCGKLQT